MDKKVFVVIYHFFSKRPLSIIDAVFETHENAQTYVDDNGDDELGRFEIIEKEILPRSVAISSETVDDC